MADRSSLSNSTSDPEGDNSAGPKSEPATGIPRWVKIFGIIALVLILLFVILHLTGRGFRGHTPPSTMIEHGMQQP